LHPQAARSSLPGESRGFAEAAAAASSSSSSGGSSSRHHWRLTFSKQVQEQWRRRQRQRQRQQRQLQETEEVSIFWVPSSLLRSPFASTNKHSERLQACERSQES